MTVPRQQRESGAISGSLISIILLVLVIIMLSVLSVWLYVQYSEKKSNVDGKVAEAVAVAKKEQADADEEKFAEREKEPNTQFVGPEDYGRLSFRYPKTWSAYVAERANEGGEYAAYFNPKIVPPVGSDQERFALRVLIKEEDYDEVLTEYESLVEEGDLKSSATSANGVNGTRFDGSFSEDVRGAVVIYKVRDKTVLVFTDADTFKPDFENIISTITFNQ